MQHKIRQAVRIKNLRRHLHRFPRLGKNGRVRNRRYRRPRIGFRSAVDRAGRA